jgi:hypothetical protein
MRARYFQADFQRGGIDKWNLHLPDGIGRLFPNKKIDVFAIGAIGNPSRLIRDKEQNPKADLNFALWALNFSAKKGQNSLLMD